MSLTTAAPGTQHADAAERVRRACAAATSTRELLEAVGDITRAELGADGSFVCTTDPVTALPNAEAVVVGLPDGMRYPWMRNEFIDDDLNKFGDLHARRVPAATLHRAIADSGRESVRHHDVNRRFGFGHEIRAVFSQNDACWGILNLVRVAGEPDFDDADLDFLAEIAEPVVEALRGLVLHRPTLGPENVTPGVVMSMKVATEKGCRRIAHWAFRYATQRRRKKITVFHKANIMKITDGLFIRMAAEEHQREYPNIDYQEAIIDAGCMRLVQDPSQFDVLLLENLYGDVISDLCAGLVGGLGVVPGANIGETHAVFEAVHGSAPDIAGKGIANPLALLMSAVMMLNYLADTRSDKACGACAGKIRLAYDKALADGCKTGDLGGEMNTIEFADAVIDRLNG